MMDGRVKTLHPKIHGGILFRRDDSSHLEQLQKHNIYEIELQYHINRSLKFEVL